VIEVAEEARGRPTMANDPTWPRAIALAHSALGRHDAAEKEIRRALELVAANDRDRISSDLLDILLKAGKNEAVLAEGDKAIKAAGGADNAPWFAFYNRGLALARLGKKADAVKELDKALGRLDPMDDLQRDSAGKVVRSMAQVSGDPKVALKRIGPWAEKDLGWRLAAAQLHLRAREMDKVIELAESVLAREKDGKLTPVMLAEAYRTLGDAYQQAQPAQFDKAIDVYTKMVERFPQDVVALNNLAYLLAEEVTPRQPQKAKKFSQQAYDIVKNWNPIDVLVVDTHGWILVQTGDKKDLEQGISHLRLVVTERPKLLEARYHLGEAYLRSNAPQEAEKELRAAAELLDQANRQKLPFDPRLASRIKEARDRAQEMMRAGADARR
jgi:tetratricopeptide (TPR) repeat protein